MNQRKKTNKRGKLSRSQYTQTIVESEFLTREISDGEGGKKEVKLPNPRYPGRKTIIHTQAPKPVTFSVTKEKEEALPV